ncbi:MAG TPA: NAD-dependent epimerase/dehydratase family protein [Dokdonella sp.]|nr:NAD-dependent epimerase/dehydratase family protein [Dokdonella sp.]
MKLLLTGAAGFVGRNFAVSVTGSAGHRTLDVTRSTTQAALVRAIADADAVIHLAGTNRPRHPREFDEVNAGFTAIVCDALRADGRALPIAYASSIQAGLDNPYGASKRAAEQRLMRHAEDTGAPVAIFRLPNVFGKWCPAHRHSVVATFCHDVARGISIEVHDASAPLQLIHVDDVVEHLLDAVLRTRPGTTFRAAGPVHRITVGELAGQIEAFERERRTLAVDRVGHGWLRALYATYVSYLPTTSFAYPVAAHADARGAFVEMLKTPDSGQVSFFTAYPGVTRGGHYHHAKVEKFLVVRGRARFRFRHLLTGETHELDTDAATPTIVDSIPGWAHDVTNTGDDELIVMLWASEVFDRARPDTFSAGTGT